MLFPRPFWPVDADMFGRVADMTAERGEFFLFYSYTHVCGHAFVPYEPPSPLIVLALALYTQHPAPDCCALGT